ncbi:hypothetical protein BJF78_23525 [Pseudonocardia sp. CNS-139]|nr:hypothetical protein BJF78_23525 [Pseudonocardia sp. CNS-139]
MAAADEVRPDRGVQPALHPGQPRLPLGPHVLQQPHLPARPQHPPRLRQRGRRVRHRAQHQAEDDGVGVPVGDRESVRDAVDHLDRHRRPGRGRAGASRSRGSGSTASTRATAGG